MTSGATADIVTLQGEVNAGKNESLVSGRPDNITSALRLHTRVNQTGDRAEVALYFLDTDYGLFNGMLFKDMVANGIRFEYSYFKANVTDGGLAPAPTIKFSVHSPSAGFWTTFLWEPYQQGTGNPIENVWVSNEVLNTTGTTYYPNASDVTKYGWSHTNKKNISAYGGLSNLANLATWAGFLNTTLPLVMATAVVGEVRIGVGTDNPGVTSYVNSLRIAVGDYDWKWTFGG